MEIKCVRCGKQIIKTCSNKKYCNGCKKQAYKEISHIRKQIWNNNNKSKIHNYYVNNMEKIKKQTRERALISKYGMTVEDFEQLKKKQHNMCAICGNILESGKKTHIDHNHETGKVRGLLCYNCNIGLGFLPSTDILKRAISYLKAEMKK